MSAAQLTITDADGRSVTLDCEVLDEPFDERQFDAAPKRTATTATTTVISPLTRPASSVNVPSTPTMTTTAMGGSLTIPLAEVYVPRERAPGPHPYRWPAPRRARVQ